MPKGYSNNPFFLKKHTGPHEHICLCGAKQGPCEILDCRYDLEVQGCPACFAHSDMVNGDPLEGNTTKYDGTPSYYKKDTQDLYDLFIAHYGLDAWQKHVEMEVIQYLWRCREKGNYLTDIKKAQVILERIVRESEGTC